MKTPSSSLWLYGPAGIHMWTEDVYALIIPVQGTLSQRVADEKDDLPDTLLKSFRLHGNAVEPTEPQEEEQMRAESVKVIEESDINVDEVVSKLPIVSVNPETCFTKKCKFVSEVEALQKCQGLTRVIQLLGRSDSMELVFPRYEEDIWTHVYNRRCEITSRQKHHITEAALALEELHSVGIVHKDFIARNVLVSSLGEIIIADLECKHTSLNIKPPETFHGEAFTSKGDVYAFSRFIWTILHCNQPRPFRTLHVEEPYSLLFAECESICPESRPTMTEVVAKLQSIASRL